MTVCTGHMGDTYRQPCLAVGVDALEGVFGHGGASSVRCAPFGRRSDERGLPGVRRLAQDRLQDFRALQGPRPRGAFGPVAAADPLRRPAAGADRKPDRALQAGEASLGAPARSGRCWFASWMATFACPPRARSTPSCTGMAWSRGSAGCDVGPRERRYPRDLLRINVSTVLAGQHLEIKQVDDGVWIVSFMSYDLGFIDLEQKTLQPLDNPFGPRLSPMSVVTHVLGTICHPCIRAGQNWIGAGEGNRTLVFSLEGCCSTIKLHPQFQIFKFLSQPVLALFRRGNHGCFNEDSLLAQDIRDNRGRPGAICVEAIPVDSE